MRKILALWLCVALAGGLAAQDTTKTYWKNGHLMSIGVQKKGVPSMGGVVIVAAIVIPSMKPSVPNHNAVIISRIT